MPSTSLPDFRTSSTLNTTEVMDAFTANVSIGLTASEAEIRRETHGTNTIPRKRVTTFDILKRQLTSSFALLLLAAAVIALANKEPVDAGMIAFFIAVNTVLGFIQEHRAEREVSSLLQYWEERARVLRAGTKIIISAKDLVPGDIVLMQAGDKVPADLRMIETRSFTVDESTLTGESNAVAKTSDPLPRPATDMFDATNIAFSGSAVLTGEATGIVIATGTKTASGSASSLAAETEQRSAFDHDIAALSTIILRLVLGTLITLFVAHVVMNGWGRASEIFLFAIALTVGVVPEALPTVSTIALSIGASRMARKHVIVKRLSAINDLGSIDVLCTDKTGTLTQNSMTVSDVHADDEDECMRIATLGSSFVGEVARGQNNAFDIAMWKKASVTIRATCSAAKKISEAPFDPVRRRNAVVVSEGGNATLIVRGSPDDVLPLCANVHDQIALGRYLATQGLSGRRVLVIAMRSGVREMIDPAGDNRGLTYVGAISFHDPLKVGAAAAVARAGKLGVAIKILTGDSREVSGAVAHQLGLIDDHGKVITGAEFDALEPGAQIEAVHTHAVFARMNPKQKFAVLALLRETHTVGFLGDGFNDAPGLKMAHVGIAVDGACDVAKESADVILLKPSLSVICDGIAEGRRTFSNIVKYLHITLAGNFGNFFAVAAASFFIPYLPMRPTQILLLNLLTDLPMIAIATDSTDTEELRKPKKYDARGIVAAAITFGVVSTIFDLATFALFIQYGEQTLQTVWFTVSILTELALFYSLRTSKPFWHAVRPPQLIIALSGIVSVAAFAIPMMPFAAAAFGFGPIVRSHVISACAIVALYFAATEFTKSVIAKFPQREAMRPAQIA